MADITAGPIKDPTNLASWTKLSLLAQVVISVVAIVSGAFEIQLLRDFQAGTFDSETDLTDAANANDLRQAIVGGVQALIFITSGVLILMWIYRANFNARRLGASGMEFSPGWAVGWHFVPFANLWKPYQAMKEIWQASANPERWEQEDRTWLLPLWWTIWIISNILGNIVFRLAFQDDPSLDQLILSSSVTLASDVLDVPLSVVFFFLVQKIHQMQMEQAQLQSFS
jgi:hypothetical protein